MIERPKLNISFDQPLTIKPEVNSPVIYNTESLYLKVVTILSTSIIHLKIHEQMKEYVKNRKLNQHQIYEKIKEVIAEYVNSFMQEDISPLIKKSLILELDYQMENEILTGTKYVTEYRITKLMCDENKFIVQGFTS